MSDEVTAPKAGGGIYAHVSVDDPHDFHSEADCLMPAYKANPDGPMGKWPDYFRCKLYRRGRYKLPLWDWRGLP